VYTARDVVLYLVSVLGQIDSLKKLTLLLFLVQYEVRKSLLTSRRTATIYLYDQKPVTRARFRLTSYGIVSDDVYSVVDEEVDRGVLVLEPHQEGSRIRLGAQPDGVAIPGPVTRRIAVVARKFGRRRTAELEEHVYKLLGLEFRHERLFYTGLDVEEYFRARGFEIRYVDLRGYVISALVES
jgi:hypothetical protein